MRKHVWILLSPCLIAVIVLAIYAYDSIFPFGAMSVAQGDMQQQYAAYYTQVWDALRGRASLLFTWNAGCGMDFWATTAQYSLLSPLNLLFFLVSREHILAFLSWFVVIKLSLCGLSATWYFMKRFDKLPPFFAVFFGVAYGLSGYSLMQFHNTMWFEIVILLPFLLYAAENVLRGKRIWPYALLLGASLILNFYISIMVCLYLLLSGGLYILLLTPAGAKGQTTLRLVLGTLAGIMLSAFVLLPAAIRLLSSARFSWNDMPTLAGAYKGYDALSGFALCNLAFAIPLLLYYFPRAFHSGADKAQRRSAGFLLGSILFVVIPLFFPGIDMVWHMGGNVSFPYRYGFLTVFAVLIACCVAVCSFREHPSGNRAAGTSVKGQWLLRALALGIFVLFLRMLILSGDEIAEILISGKQGYAYFTVSGALVYLLAFAIKEQRIRRALALLTLCAQLACYGVSMFAPKIALPASSAVEGNRLAERFGTDSLSRVKNTDISLGMNYGFFLDQPTVGSFCSTTSDTMHAAIVSLGQTDVALGIYDVGGSLFSDALLNVRYRLVESTNGDAAPGTIRIPSSAAETDGFSIDSYRYKLPFGVVMQASALQIPQSGTPFAVQNALFSAVSRSDEALFHDCSNQWQAGDAAGEWSMEFSFSTPEVLYLYDSQRNDLHPVQVRIEENGAPLRTFVQYPELFNNGLLELGEYSMQRVTVRLYGPENTDVSRFTLGKLRLVPLAELCRAQTEAPAVTNLVLSNRKLSLTAHAKQDGDVLFLPITAYDGWRCDVDGRTEKTAPILNAFLGVPLQEGAHSIALSYWPEGMTAGLLISAIGALLIVSIAFGERKERLLAQCPKWLSGTALTALILIWSGVIVVLYVYPVLHGLWVDFLYQCRY